MRLLVTGANGLVGSNVVALALDDEYDVVATYHRTKAIGLLEAKNDHLDAKLLAQLRWADLLADSYVPPEEIRERRALVRECKRLVDKRADFENEVHVVLDKEGVSFDGSPFSQAGQERLLGDEFDLSEVGQTLLDSLLAVIRELTEQIHQLEAVIEATAVELEETQLAMTDPGVSFYSSLLITPEFGENDRFDSAEQVISYAGLDPVVRESGDTRTEGGISKQGSGNLR